MIPGTPLISTIKIKQIDVVVQVLSVFSSMNTDDVNLYDPKSNKIIVGSSKGIMTLDGKRFNPESFVVAKWEELMPDDLVITENFCIVRGADVGTYKETNEFHIKEAIRKYQDFGKKKK